MSSVRTGRVGLNGNNNKHNAHNLNRRDSDQPSILKLLDGVSNIQK